MDAIGVTAGIGITATAVTATVGTAIAGIGPVMELSAAKFAGARSGAQGTFVVDGSIRTTQRIERGGLRLAPLLG